MKTNHVSDQSNLYILFSNSNSITFPEVYVNENQKVIYNPPPRDQMCEACGTHVSELETFDEEFCAWFTELQQLFESINPNVRKSLITPDHKLAIRIRRFGEDKTTVSWECVNCFFLSDEDVNRQNCDSSQENCP